MENRHAKLIKDFETNLQKIILERNSFKEENAQLQKELAFNREELIRAHNDIQSLRNEIKLIQAASGIGGSVHNRSLSRKELSKMVQEIDKCLALLNE